MKEWKYWTLGFGIVLLIPIVVRILSPPIQNMFLFVLTLGIGVLLIIISFTSDKTAKEKLTKKNQRANGK